MVDATQFAITLTPELYARMSAEATQLGVPLEWVVASLVVDTFEADRPGRPWLESRDDG
jgi:hypothetical protein